jgi:antirestriction protein ArdC
MTEKLDVYSRVTNKIVADLQRGDLTWLSLSPREIQAMMHVRAQWPAPSRETPNPGLGCA